MRRLKEDILQLRSEGKSYNEICKILNCSKGAVSFHCGDGQKEKSKARQTSARSRLNVIVSSKIQRFSEKHSTNDSRSCTTTFKKMLKCRIEGFSKMTRKNREYIKPKFSGEDFLNKIGHNPVCYISGKSINLLDRRSWVIDHMIPRSRGGNNSLENAGICDTLVNSSKTNMTPEEFFDMCKMVLEHNGYDVSKKKLNQ